MTKPKLPKIPGIPKGNGTILGTGVIVPRRFDLSRYVHELVHAYVVDYAVSNLVVNKTESDFEEMPVSFRTFVESTEHMGFMPLSDRQLAVVDFMLGDDPDKMFKNGNYLAVLAFGKGSLLGHQEIYTADGKRMTLKECAEQQLPTFLWTKTAAGSIATQVSTPAILKDHKEECFKVTTAAGQVSEASEDHKYLTVKGWRKLSDLHVGDWICGAQTIAIPNVYNKSADLGRWVGYMLGDGCMRGHFSFYASFPEIISDFCAVAGRLGCTTQINPGTTPGAKAISIQHVGKGGHNCNPLREEAKRLGMMGSKAETKRIPVEVIYSGEGTRRALVEGLFATDGWISGKSGEPRSWEIGYIAKNRKLIEDLDFVLKSFGIVGKIRAKTVKYRNEPRVYWQLMVESSRMQVLFCQEFIVPHKHEKQKQLLSDKARAKVVAGSVCPKELSELLVAGLPPRNAVNNGGRWDGYAKRLRYGNYFGYDTVCAAPWMAAVANRDILWEQIKAIEPLGMQDVYTFTVPETHNYLQGGLFHHNSGKDAICVLILCYVCYTLLCMRSPQKYFEQPEGEYIDCVNVAPSGAKASTVFFEKLRQRLLRWQWLKNKYPIRSSGAFVSQLKPKPGDAFATITKDGVIFPKLIRLLSRNSANESAEGLNTLLFTMDEASAFQDDSKSRNADKLYRVLRSSSRTRFGSMGKGFIISYPRELNDFTLRMYNSNLGNLHVYTDKAATWEVLPKGLRFKSGNFVFEGRLVPNELKEDFEKNPTEAKMMYMAEPPESEHGFIEYPEKILECVVQGARGMVSVEDYIKDSKVCKRILNFVPGLQAGRDYIVTVDLGRSEDTAALSVFHREEAAGKAIFVQDLVTGWTPDKANKYVVSFTDITEFILALSRRINIIGCWFDQWQSVSMRETLSASAIPAHEYMLDYADHKTFKELIYTKRYRLLPFEPQITEMRKLVDNGTRVDHTKSSHNDYVSTVVGATKVFMAKYRTTNSGDEWGEVETIEENLTTGDPWG